ncbi:MAG: hypothetical protein IPF98_08535 [Gemmatimonadetes bacterium]|nr:hypothetical protein [Gemmatimonadota bacterium]
MTPRLVVRLCSLPLIVFYALRRLGDAGYWDLVDDLNLAIHEAGHLVFQPLGEPGLTLGGSLFQVIVPAAFVIYFVRRRQRFAAAIVTAWVATSLLNVAIYISDARAQLLPLLGGDDTVHDWWFLLTEWDLLPHDTTIGRAVRLCSAVAWILSVGGALAFAREDTGAQPEDVAPLPGDARLHAAQGEIHRD